MASKDYWVDLAEYDLMMKAMLDTKDIYMWLYVPSMHRKDIEGVLCF